MTSDSFKSKTGFRYHHESVHKVKKFICEVCGQHLKSKSYLLLHVNIVHKGITLNCNQCNKEFRTQNTIKNHKKTVHGLKRYPCSIFDYKAPFQSDLKQQKQNVHECLRQKCTICGLEMKGLRHLFFQRSRMLTCRQTELPKGASHDRLETEIIDDPLCCSAGRADNRQSRKSRRCLVAL